MVKNLFKIEAFYDWLRQTFSHLITSSFGSFPFSSVPIYMPAYFLMPLPVPDSLENSSHDDSSRSNLSDSNLSDPLQLQMLPSSSLSSTVMYSRLTSAYDVQLPYIFSLLFSNHSLKGDSPSSSLMSQFLPENEFYFLVSYILSRNKLPWDFTTFSLLRPYINLLKGETVEKNGFDQKAKLNSQAETLIGIIKIKARSHVAYKIIHPPDTNRLMVDFEGGRFDRVNKKNVKSDNIASQSKKELEPRRDADLKPDIEGVEIISEPQRPKSKQSSKLPEIRKMPMQVTLKDICDCSKQLLFLFALKLELNLVTLDDAWECYATGNFIMVCILKSYMGMFFFFV
jgi:hypothetical protein